MKAVCEICGERPAAFVCSVCGRKVCADCFDMATWTCSSCRQKLSPPASLPHQLGLPTDWLALGIALLLIGSLLMALGVFLSGQAKGFLFVFPFFVFASSAMPSYVFPALLVLSVAFILAVFLAFLKWFAPGTSGT